jgi:hypothetical protein
VWAVLSGASMPYILLRERGFWRLVGECFVKGIMKGEEVVVVVQQEGVGCDEDEENEGGLNDRRALGSRGALKPEWVELR